MEFPVFRKYKNNRSFFKILSEEEFEELKMNAGRCDIHRFRVKQLPDRNFLLDMLYHYEKYWDKIEEKEYERVKAKCSD